MSSLLTVRVRDQLKIINIFPKMMRTSSRFLAKQFIEPSLPVVLSVKVRHKDLDDEAMIVQPTHPQAFTSKPVSVQDLVGETIERELVKGRV